ncbi:MAG: SCO family protein [Acidimicrobiales bacterium]
MTPRHPVGRRAFLGAGLAAAGLAAVGCSDDSTAANDDDLGFAGTVLGIPLAKPTVVFTDTSGKPYDVGVKTAGHLSLMLFGYTSCPDVCPVHLSILASTLKHMTGPASKTTVIFVGVDTERDTPKAIRTFLDNRDRDFVGLTAAPADIETALKQLQLPPTVIEPKRPDGSYVVGHASQILAFTPDNLCHILYPFGVVEQQWSKDLPRLETFDWPDTRR